MDSPISSPVVDPLLDPARRPRSRAPDRSPGVLGFEQIMRQHNQRLYRLAFSLIGDASEAEDVLQDSYVRAFNGLPHFTGRSSLGSWLAAIVRNVAIDYLRLRRARQGSYTLEADLVRAEDDAPSALENAPAPVEPTDPVHSREREEFRALLQQAIATLPDAYRAAFMLREVEGLSVEETADYLGIPPATVKTRDLRARALLRVELGPAFEGRADETFEFLRDRCDRIVFNVLSRLSVL
jgi:RNA polymerase sigma-70 factor (ECF subfamily)